ncbi:MAG: alanine--tRNA ligase [Clostridia bacterium]|nr:MAG: alanine--tRNA ligase [Clostridia bacterium]
MKKYGLNQLREMFLRFFESKGHLRLPSFSLIPQNDASLLLINSGMAPMKPFFKGEQEPPRNRVCTCQKCIRTGDIENIGKTARHGTYFEMLGNFSFGDYFKHEAIAWSWEFLTSPDWVGIDPDRLYPSIYQDDEEAFEIWNKEIGIAPERIFRFGKEDNFWEHGAGPCGPCSEIYYDRGEKYGCGKPGCTVGCDCDRYIEVWNNVFSQFDNDGEGHYTELAQKNIDTGMGLERLAVVCQGVDSLFDVDTIMNITHKVSEITGAYYGRTHKMDVSLRVITDHIRSAVFMICDGVLPSNEGRGYVLRRLLRRAARHGKLLGVNEAFLYSVVETVVKENECQYPELREKEAYITRVVKNEEENFAKTIDAGMRIFAELLEAHKAKGERIFSGADAFKLYDTYGFPIDLTVEMCADEDMSVNEDEFRKLMEEQRVRARKAREALGDLGWAGIDFGKEMPETVFEGYDKTVSQAEVLAIVTDGELQNEISSGAEAIVVLDRTPMYAEMGGQSADHGAIRGAGFVFAVNDVQKNKGGKYMHYGVMKSGSLRVGDKAEAEICPVRRAAISRAHSATHLLQQALREVLGEHVHQAGSLVEPDFLRFDFTHFSAVSPEELRLVEDKVNEAVLAGYPVDVREMPIEEARNCGATALFGEKYGDVVRVVNMGGYSVELCGGTHMKNTAMAGAFHISSEGSVASGVRRIEATTGRKTMELLHGSLDTINTLAAAFKANCCDVVSRVAHQGEELKEARRLLQQYKDKESAGSADALLGAAKDVGGLHVVASRVDCCDAGALRKLGDALRDKDANAVAVIAAVNGGKISFQCVCGREAVAKGVRAGDIIRSITAIAGGKGGGKPDSAMGGGNDPAKLGEALAAVEKLVEEKI